MSSSSRPLSSSLVAVPESCAAASPYFSYSSTSSPHSAFSSSPSPSFSSSSSSSSSHSSSSFSSTLPSSNFGSINAEYYQQNHHHHHHQLPMMAASLDGSNMMKLYNSNGNSKLESFESNNSSWNGGLYGNGTTKVPAYQQQQSQPQQQLDQINFLVRKECCNEIDQAVKELGISADPFNWSVSDVQKWLLWMQRWVQLPSLKLEHFAMDGMSLCALTEEDFRQRVPNGEKLYAKLDIWRMAFNYFGATDFDSIFGEFQEDNNSNNSYGQQQQHQQQQYCASPYSTSSSTDASSLYSGSSPISPEGYGVSNGSGCGSLPTYAESMYGGGMCGNGSIASPASPASSSHSSVNSCSPYGQQQQNSYSYGQTMVAPQQQQQQQYGKASILPMNDFSNMANTGAMITAVVNGGGAQPMQQQRMVATSDYGSDAIPSDDDDMSDDEKCFLEFQHHHHRMTLQQQQQQQHQQQLMQLQQQQQQQQQQMQSVVGNGRGSLPLSVPQIKVESRADYSPSTSPVYHQGLQHHPQQHQHQQHLMQQQQQQFGHPRPSVHHQQHQQRQYAQHPNGMVVGNHSISVVKSELPSSSSTTTPIAVPAAPVPTAPAVAVAPVRTSSSHIHLWQFLKELLSGPHQYGSSIRWLDRSKGVFKIEDSVSVAKLWGARKNRPAMNYDKLSRSIRQYYKKGIMKKTERSQRLVYQFCAPYAL